MRLKIFRFCVCLGSCAKGTGTLYLRIYDKVLRIKYVRPEGVSTSHSRVPTEPYLPEENPPQSQCRLWQPWRDSRRNPLLHLSDYLSGPITIKCGHNFCCYCIWKSWSRPRPLHPPSPPWECRAETRACFRGGQRATQVQQWRSKQGRMPRFSWWNSTSCSRSVKRVWPSSMLK